MKIPFGFPSSQPARGLCLTFLTLALIILAFVYITIRRSSAEHSVRNHIEGSQNVRFKFTSNEGRVVEFITDSATVVKKKQFKHTAVVDKDGIIVSVNNQPVQQK
jgi:uncharacterized protein YpmS